MSELSAEEKRRILRERRQAKMAKGNATNRLNEILSQGASVKTNAKSVLDEDVKPTTPQPELKSSGTPLHDDPEIPDISTLLQSNVADSTNDSAPDMDEMFKKIFSGALGQNPQAAEGDAQGENQNPFISQIMQMMSEDTGEEADPAQTDAQSSFNAQLVQYCAYQERKIKVHLLIIRYIIHIANFLFHYTTVPSFQSSPHLYIRGLNADVQSQAFFTYFLAFEIVFISAYFGILASKGLLGANTKKHFISKALNFGSLVLPSITRYRHLIESILIYSEGVGIFAGDVALIVVLFGVVSLYG
ncbi:hypothetical protein CJJ07_002523 [Candidozyma auris]|nr:hypothetical protein CJJ07_002523 [[Candida] auris]QEL59277.1 hypothetical protein CJJ09_001350 [[Candida] auris]